ncbi:MAG: glucans biosynthesis glucosyltransferase MdoH [Pseudomonadota bacterium]
MDDLRTDIPHTRMPPVAPTVMPVQALDRPYRDDAAPGASSASFTGFWRLATFLPAIAATCALIAAFTDWFAMDGFSAFEGVVIGLIAFTFFWIALSVSTALLGVTTLMLSRPKVRTRGPVRPMDVALLVPIFNEDAADVFGNAAAMLTALDEQPHVHRYDLFILSDTRDPLIAEQEERAFLALHDQLSFKSNVYYRRREMNTDRKVGNLSDWIAQWSGHYTAMLVLDADSLMSGEAIISLTDAMAIDESAGLIQSFPTLFGAQTLFGRVQQFSNRVYGAALAEGLAKWTDREGNYWGHNAIIRTAAFASCAGLPKVKGRRGEGKLILSHDFIEAGLLRRAGWSVRFMPRIGGSYEEVPATLIDYVLRDRRWCQGNLQHLSLIGTRGFHAVSRFHLVSGAMGYLMSPAWFALLLVWALIGNGQETSAITYFSGFDPQVSWPKMTTGNAFAILAFMYGMLLAPKMMGAAAARRAGIKIREMGGIAQFVWSLILEITLSILYAPVMMVQQTIAVIRTALGFRESWAPQQRRGGQYSLATMAKFHLVETVMGWLLVAGMVQGLVTLWLLPIAVSLAGAVLLSALSGVNLGAKRWSSRQMGTPEHLNAPEIIRAAMAERKRFAMVLAQPDPPIAAE